MNLKERKKVAIRFYTRGKSLIETSKKIHGDYGFDILLYIGIELILKSYLVIKDQDISEDKLRKYGHNLEELRKDASKYDDLNVISSDDFQEIIDNLKNKEL